MQMHAGVDIKELRGGIRNIIDQVPLRLAQDGSRGRTTVFSRVSKVPYYCGGRSASSHQTRESVIR